MGTGRRLNADGGRTGPVIARYGVAAVACIVALAGCGSSQHFANDPRPPSPINLTVYVTNDRVSVSPASIGAGQVDFYVTNQARGAETVAVVSTAGRTIARTEPINPGSIAQVHANLATGSYEIAAGAPIDPAMLRIGAPRPSSNNTLLQP